MPPETVSRPSSPTPYRLSSPVSPRPGPSEKLAKSEGPKSFSSDEKQGALNEARGLKIGHEAGNPRVSVLAPPRLSGLKALGQRLFGVGGSGSNSWRTTMLPALRDQDYRALFTTKMCNQIGSGMAYGSYAFLLQQVGIQSVSQGLLAMWGLGHIESLALALIINPATATERDQYNRKERAKNTSPAEANALQSELAAKLWTCETINTAITLGTVAATLGVAAGVLGGGFLFVTLAFLQVARACTMNFQLAYTNALKAFIRDDACRNDVMRDSQYYFNSVEQGYGRVVLMSSTIGLVQWGISALPPTYALPAVAGTLIGSSLVTLAGKWPLRTYLSKPADERHVAGKPELQHA